jgi:hypothetical protein
MYNETRGLANKAVMFLENKSMKEKKDNSFSWYSNEKLSWVLARCVLIALVGFLVVILLGLEEHTYLLFPVVGVPLILTLFNSFSVGNSKKEQNSEK